MNTYQKPTLSHLCYDSITRYAERVGEHHRVYSQEGKADVSALVEVLGGETVPARDSTALLVRAPKNFTVYLPTLTSSRRDRFTIAHELGHYFLHYLYPERNDVCAFVRGQGGLADVEANFFASALLMPTAAFLAVAGKDSREVGRLFGVSPRAAMLRAGVLNVTLADGACGDPNGL